MPKSICDEVTDCMYVCGLHHQSVLVSGVQYVCNMFLGVEHWQSVVMLEAVCTGPMHSCCTCIDQHSQLACLGSLPTKVLPHEHPCVYVCR